MGWAGNQSWAAPHQAVHFGSWGNSKCYTLCPHCTPSLKAKARHDCATWLVSSWQPLESSWKIWTIFYSHLHINNPLPCYLQAVQSKCSTVGCVVLSPFPKSGAQEHICLQPVLPIIQNLTMDICCLEQHPAQDCGHEITFILTETFQVQVWMSACWVVLGSNYYKSYK